MNYSISKIIPYVRRYVLLGIYDVLDGGDRAEGHHAAVLRGIV